MESKVIYRLPGTDTSVRLRQTTGSPELLTSIDELTGHEGFVFAPFAPSASTPVILIHPDVTEEISLAGEERTTSPSKEMGSERQDEEERMEYADLFSTFRRSMEKGEFLKIVLARSSRQELTESVDEEACDVLFRRACAVNPNSMVALVSTPVSGTWLIATPEPLLRHEGEKWHTAAFDCTRRADDLDYGWSDAELYQQRMMTNCFLKTIAPFATDVEEKGPDTVVINHLAHISTDLSFTLKEGVGLGTLLSALHPTPAVCGQPKAKAYQFILGHEQEPRGYFSGFLGSVGPVGTHLFVTLRCMRIQNGCARLYAGSGILADSDEQTEWNDTQMKMQVMRELLRTLGK